MRTNIEQVPHVFATFVEGDHGDVVTGSTALCKNRSSDPKRGTVVPTYFICSYLCFRISSVDHLCVAGSLTGHHIRMLEESKMLRRFWTTYHVKAFPYLVSYNP